MPGPFPSRKDRPIPPALALGAGLVLYLAGLLLPLALLGDWYRLFQAVLTPEARPSSFAQWLGTLAGILPKNLGILLVAAYLMPLLPRVFPSTPRTLPVLYALVLAFVLGLISTPSQILFGPWYLLLTVPVALMELLAYLLAALHGQDRAFGLPARPRFFLAAFLLILAGGAAEAWVITTFWRS